MRLRSRAAAAGKRWGTFGPVGLMLLLPALGQETGGSGPGASGVLKTEHFDRDPGWEGYHNHLVPEDPPIVIQDFGYSATHFAGRAKGEVGGRVQRSTTHAAYAEKIAVKTLDDPLSASGTFALTASSGNSGLFFGWFNARQPGGGRPMNSLGLDMDCEGSGARLAVRMITGTNRTCGTFITPFIPGKYRPTPIRADGTRYSWTLEYDPRANQGDGQFRFTLTSQGGRPEEFEGKPFTVNLPPGFQREGATFDRFGLSNMMKSGGAVTIYFDDLQYDGKTEDFSRDPGWVGSGNRVTFQDPEQAGAHNFGFRARTNGAGGAVGEVGGDFWRTDKDWGYYADRIGPLTLDDPLKASGKVRLEVGAPDSDMRIGWFRSPTKSRGRPPAEAGPFLGIHVGGPTRIGHYFRPALATQKGARAETQEGPVLVPGRVYEWSLAYDPAANGGRGALRVSLGEETVTLALQEGQKAQLEPFDRFGLLTCYPGGQLVRIAFDDLTYTAGRPSR